MEAVRWNMDGRQHLRIARYQVAQRQNSTHISVQRTVVDPFRRLAFHTRVLYEWKVHLEGVID